MGDGLDEPDADKNLIDRAAGQLRRLVRRDTDLDRFGDRQAVVPHHATDLFDEVDLPLDVQPVHGHGAADDSRAAAFGHEAETGEPADHLLIGDRHAENFPAPVGAHLDLLWQWDRRAV